MSTVPPRPLPHSPSFHPRATLSSLPLSHSHSNSHSLSSPPTSSSSLGKGHKRSSSAPWLEGGSRSIGLGLGLSSGSSGSGLKREFGNGNLNGNGNGNGHGNGNGKEDDKLREAKAILKILSSLPAPLPPSLPQTFLPTPAPSPPSSKTFESYITALSSSSPGKRKRASRLSTSTSSNSPPEEGEDSPSPTEGVGKRFRRSSATGLNSSGAGGRLTPIIGSSPVLASIGLTPSSSSTGNLSSGSGINGPGSVSMRDGSQSGGGNKREVGKSGLRNEIRDEERERVVKGSGSKGSKEREEREGKEGWSREKWKEAAHSYSTRALLLKRHGDAHSRAPNAPTHLTSTLTADPLQGLLCHTDAVLLWLYSYFCDEQAGGRVRSSPYNESERLRRFVRERWEGEMRREGSREEIKEMAKGMVGLMYLIDAVVCYHLTAEQLAHLHRRGKELSLTSSTHGPSPSSTTSVSPPAHPQPSPAAASSTSSSHPHPTSHPSTEPSPPSSTYNFPGDLLPLITASTSTSARASQHLLTSRHHLPLRQLRKMFPKTYEHCINSELSDEALPAPGDMLGAARRVDMDIPTRFVWPIELGMWSPVAHVCAFGRCLVEEFAEVLGIDWDLRLGVV